MSELNDVLQELEVQANLSEELVKLFKELESDKAVMEELDYSNNSKGATWGSLRVIDAETTKDLIAKLQELVELVHKNEKDPARALANEIAIILKNA